MSHFMLHLSKEGLKTENIYILILIGEFWVRFRERYFIDHFQTVYKNIGKDILCAQMIFE